MPTIRSKNNHILLVGGGHSHISVLRSFGRSPPRDARVTLVSRERFTPYSGMLPGLIAGHYRREEAHIDLAALAAYAGARFIHDEVMGLDLKVQCARLRDSLPLHYDVLALDTGSAPATQSIVGAAEHAVPVKPIGQFLARWQELRVRFSQWHGPMKLAVVGAGAGGVELCLAIHHALAAGRYAGQARAPELALSLVAADPDILSAFPARVSRRLRRILQARGIRIVTGQRVVEIRAGDMRLESGTTLAADAVLLATHAAAPHWPREAGLAVDGRGFVAVDRFLRSLSHPNVFAAGDIAALEGHTLPKAGVFAVRQGPVLDRNLRRLLLNQALEPYEPQQKTLALITTGNRYAIAARGGWSVEGGWVWYWKRWIDQRFVRRYQGLAAAPSGAGTDGSGAGR